MVWVLGFVFLFFFLFFFWISGLVFFLWVRVLFFYFWVSGLASERESFRRTVRFFKRITLYVSVFEGGIFTNVSTPG